MASANLSLSYKQDIWDTKCTVTEISAFGNYRTISLKLEVRTKDFTGGRDGGYHVDCEEGGDIGEKSCVVPGSSQSRLVLYDESFDVYVAPGQTYADILFDFEIHFYSSSAGVNRSLSGTITRITGLSVVSDATISSAKDIYFGDNVSITWTPPATTFAYRLKFVMGEYSHTTDILTPNKTSAYTYSGLNIPVTEARNIPNSEYGTMSVTMTQYKDSSATETIGSSVTKNFKITLRDDIIPKISSYGASINNNECPAISSWGIGLVGYSRIDLAASASGVYGSTIKNFTITGDYIASVSGESLEYTGDVISASGNKTFVITCTDSRGRTSAAVSTDLIHILPYTPPKLTSLSTTKEEYGDKDITNDRMVVTAVWEYDSVNGYNSASGAVYYKESSAADWTRHKGTLTNNIPFTLSSLQLDDTKSYNFKVVVTDVVGNSSEKSSFSSTTQVLLDFRAGGKGLGIGKICERDGMEVSMDATFYNNINLLRNASTVSIEDYITSLANNAIAANKNSFINSIYPIGSIYISMNADNPKDVFGVGEWDQLEGRFLLGAGSYSEDGIDYYYEVGSVGGENKHTLTVEEMPSHDHYGVARFDYDIKAGTHPSAEQTDSTTNLPRTNSTGGSNPHNNMPPYLVAYMWKRTG